MGGNDRIRFDPFDYFLFKSRLKRETDLLGRWLSEGRLTDSRSIGGFELEAWLLDRHGQPTPNNQTFLERLGSPLVVPELSAFNVEFNTEERALNGKALSHMEKALNTIWNQAVDNADKMDARLMMIGTLPSVTPDHLTEVNMTPLVRYRALNEQVISLQGGRPIQLDIQGRDHLYLEHSDILLEAATTSFQIHLQIDSREAARFINAAMIVSAILVGIGANAPYLFGHDLWAETRIPVFEQSIPLGRNSPGSGPFPRVTFGRKYIQEGFMELFEENRDAYPPILPISTNDRPERMHHLHLHNSTIWRWNRPLVGFNGNGEPHLRIENRVTPAGPTVRDTIANAAFFYGLVHHLARGEETPPESRLPFESAENNFYTAARIGMDAKLVWLDGERIALRSLVMDQLIPLAAAGLSGLGLDADESRTLLEVVADRAGNGQNGAAWQRAWVARHGADMSALTLAYLDRQTGGAPVHTWDLTC